MSDTIQFAIKQNKGKTNSVRVFFNEEFLDEFDTTSEFEIKTYDIDINDGDVNKFFIQVLNSHTVIDNNISNNILSSNTVKIEKIFIHQNKTDSNIECNYITFKKNKDPIYEIFTKQKNIPYHTINPVTQSSEGNGVFALFFIPISYKSLGLKDNPENTIEFDRHTFIINPWYADDHPAEWDRKNQKEIRVKKTLFDMETMSFAVEHKEVSKFIKEILDARKVYNLVEHLELNITNALRFYED